MRLGQKGDTGRQIRVRAATLFFALKRTQAEFVKNFTSPPFPRGTWVPKFGYRCLGERMFSHGMDAVRSPAGGVFLNRNHGGSKGKKFRFRAGNNATPRISATAQPINSACSFFLVLRCFSGSLSCGGAETRRFCIHSELRVVPPPSGRFSLAVHSPRLRASAGVCLPDPPWQTFRVYAPRRAVQVSRDPYGFQ
jgi:hypothetical protein